MYTIVKEIHNPTVVEHCIYCHFFNFREKNLVVACFNQLKVYRLVGESWDNEEADGIIDGDDDDPYLVRKDDNVKVKLECLKTIPLYCEICCLKSIKLTGSKRDSLLISFADAKLALVEYDPTNHDLKTLSLHYFEEEEMKEGRTQYPRFPLIRVDPEGRCAAMLAYGRTIIILPFRKDLGAMEEAESNGTSTTAAATTITTISSTGKIIGSVTKGTAAGITGDSQSMPKSAVMASYKLNLSDKQYAEEKIHNIIDFQFLNGYYEPTLLILHEPVRTWAGRVAVRRDTCSMVTLSLNVHQRVHPVIWSTSHLPYDCFAALPVPKPVGGVIIFAVNSLIYLNQSVPPYAVSLNSFADATTSFTKTIQKGVKLSLDCSKACFVSNDKLVISLKGGELYVVTLFSDGMRSIRDFHFDKSASSVISSCITCCEEGYLFLGSRLGNSLLLKYTEKVVEGIIKVENGMDSSSALEDDPLLAGSPVPEVLGEEIEPTSSLPSSQQPIENGPLESEGMEVENEDNVNDLPTMNNAAINNIPTAETAATDSSPPPADPVTISDNNHESMDDEVNSNNLYNTVDEDHDSNIDDTDQNMEDEEDVSNRKPADIGDWAAGDVALMKDPDELEVYGHEETDDEKLPTSFSFELCDSLINIGPCGRISMGEPAFVSEDFATQGSEPQVELVATSGYGKNGALCVLQRTIRPQLVTTFELPNCLDMWTVYGPSNPAATNTTTTATSSPSLSDSDDTSPSSDPLAKASDKNQNFHAFLIVTRADSTMILQTEQEINELDHSGVCSQTPTIFAGNLADGKYILQVSPMAVRLLEGTRQIQHVPLDLGSPIVYASLIDPYGVILTHQGVLVVLTLKFDSSTGTPRLAFSRPSLPPTKSKIVTICVYKDVSGKFTTEQLDTSAAEAMHHEESKLSGHSGSGLNLSEAAQISQMAATVDDEDELLYGNSSIEMVTTVPDENLNHASGIEGEPSQKTEDKMIAPKKITVPEEADPTFWLFAVRENGVLEVFRLADFETVFYAKNFPMGPKVLIDTVPGSESTQTDSVLLPVTREVLVAGMGLKHSRPILFARFDSEIFIYELFPYFETQIPNHLKIRFRRKETTLIVREPRLVRQPKQTTTGNININLSASRNLSSDKNSGPSSSTASSSSAPSTTSTNVVLDRETMHQRWFRPFSDVSGYSGVFICGLFPHWCFMTTRGELRIHEMNIDGPVLSFAPFHNVNCPKGFLYFNSKHELRIAVLPTHVTYDAPWPVRKVPLRCTINFVNYHVDSKCYCVVTSTQEPYNKLVRVGGEEKDYDVLERDARYIWPTTDRFHIQLFSPVSWELIPGTKIDLDEWEHVTCLKNVMLNSEGTESGLKGYIAAGTNYCYGEDVTNRGRIWIFDIIDVVPELGQPLTRSKIKIVYCKEQKGPVTAICQIRGLLLSAVGQKIYIWQLKESQLVGVAFIDTQIYIHQAVSVKNLILIADVYKSISLLRYQEDSRTLALVSRDCRSFEVYACGFLVDSNQLCFLVADGDKNLLLYSYQPDSRESCGGTRLIRKGDYHIGSHVNCFFRIRCKYPSLGSLSKPSSSSSSSSPSSNGFHVDLVQKKVIEQRQATVFPTLDGTINFILPISEKTYRRLFMLQNTMNAHIQHTAGINPKGVHMVKFNRKNLTNPCKNVLDGDLLYRFFNLSMSEKAELCKKISSTPDQIIDDLQEIDRITAHF